MATKSLKPQTKKKKTNSSASAPKKDLTLMEMTNIEYLFELSETLFGCWASTEALMCERDPIAGIEGKLLDRFKSEDVIDSVRDEIQDLADTFSSYYDVLYPMADELQWKARRLAELTGQKIRNDWLPD